MLLYPKEYLNNVKEITIDYLEKNNLKGLILDVDNTLIDYDKKMLEGVEEWCKDLKEKNIKFCIVSNSNKIKKIKVVAEKLSIPYIAFAKKPLKYGFIKAKKILELNNENIAVVGDQIFTDIIGANKCKMHSILVKPIKEKDILITLIKRPIEKLIINKYLNKK